MGRNFIFYETQHLRVDFYPMIHNSIKVSYGWQPNNILALRVIQNFLKMSPTCNEQLMVPTHEFLGHSLQSIEGFQYSAKKQVIFKTATTLRH